MYKRLSPGISINIYHHKLVWLLTQHFDKILAFVDAIGAELDVNPAFGVNIIPVKAWMVDSEMTIKNKGYNFILALFFIKICINLIQVNFRLK